MSPDADFNARLRDARAALPEPDSRATNRARALALGAIGRRRHRLRSKLVIGASLALALALGVGLGTLVTPSGSAARGPMGVGFLPANGWNVVQTGAPATVEQPLYAVAANVPIDPEDLVSGGAPDPSGLPYATLLNLRSQGIVIVATFTKLASAGYFSPRPPEQSLPLQMRDALPNIVFGKQVRPEEPLGEYQLRAIVDDYDVNLDVYFGTPTPTLTMLDAAQRQIDRMVVRAPRASTVERTPRRLRAIAPTRGIIDRTLVCSTSLVGGARQIEVKGHAGTGRNRATWGRPAWAALASGVGTLGGSNPSALDNSLAWVTAGRPSASSTFVEGNVLSDLYRVRIFGTLAFNARRCRATKERVVLAGPGLQGGVLGPFEDGYECVAPRRVLLHVRGILRSAATGLRGYRAFLRTTLPVSEGQLAVRSESGRLLAYAEVDDSGRARLFAAPSCTPS